MNHDNPQALVRPLPFRNVSDEVVPAFAAMTVLGVSFENGIAFLQCGKPDATLRRQLAVNGPQEVGIGRRGTCQRGGDVRALLDNSGEPAPGDSWGIKPGQWQLSRYYSGCTLQGLVSEEHRIARVACEAIERLLVKTTTAVAARAVSTAYRVFVGPPGAEVDAGFTTLPAAHNRGRAIPAGHWAHLVWIGGQWELRPLSPATMVAVPPCGLGIPPRSGDVPGQRECCLFALDEEGELAAVTDSEGALLRAPVYNLREREIPPLDPPGRRYLLIHSDPGGRWVCEVPDSASEDPDSQATTTSTAAPTTTTTTAGPICAGTAKWIWSEAEQAWSLAESGCLTGVISTTDEPTTTTTTAAPPNCLCPTTTTTTTTGDPSTTSSSTTSTSTEPTTSTTTTTTPEPCQPLYPDHCGTVNGECTYTSCAAGPHTPTIDCTTTTTSTTPEGTTTTCDCNTTTTADPGPNCTHCEWYNHPLLGLVQTFNGCGGSCTCSPPASVEACASAQTPCVANPPVPTPPPVCEGTCYWLCVPGEGWHRLQFSGCSGNIDCRCPMPTVPCQVCGSPAETACQPWSDPAAPTTTTPEPGPCADCYTTTTTSTTTTPPPCGPGCVWQGSAGGSWTSQSNGCTAGCTCQPPAYAAQDDCETAHTPCFATTTTGEPTTTTTTTTSTTTSTTTTSTTTTSTTTTAEPYWCGNPTNFEGPCNECFQASEAEVTACSYAESCAICSGPHATLAECQLTAGCEPTTTTTISTTTTTTTTSTTTTTCDPNFDCGGECNIICSGLILEGGHFVLHPNNTCDGETPNCGCSSFVAELYYPGLIGSPCNAPDGPYSFPCCNPCPGAFGPSACGNITTTTPAP